MRLSHQALLSCSAALALAVFGAAAPASAQDQPSADLRGSRVPLSEQAGLHVDPVSSPASGEVHVAVRTSYAYRPIALRDAAGEAVLVPLEHQLTGDVLLAVGLLGRLTLSLDLPVVIAQTGDDSALDPRAARLVERGGPPLSALGDPALGLKATLVAPERDRSGLAQGFGLAFVNRLAVPLGDERAFLGEGSVTNDARLLADLGLGAVSLHLGAGVKLRGDEGRYACDPDEAEVSCASRFGHELPFVGGVALHPRALGLDDEGRATLFLETRGWLPLAPIAPFEASEPAGWFASVAGRYRFGDVSLLGGVEWALADGVGNAPLRVTLGLSFAPRGSDADDDGLDDTVDACPHDREDFDGHEDRDGCPELDNDGDRIPDELDACPDRAGSAETRGCPGLLGD